jgi:hypothetical protein
MMQSDTYQRLIAVLDANQAQYPADQLTASCRSGIGGCGCERAARLCVVAQIIAEKAPILRRQDSRIRCTVKERAHEKTISRHGHCIVGLQRRSARASGGFRQLGRPGILRPRGYRRCTGTPLHQSLTRRGNTRPGRAIATAHLSARTPGL